MIKAAETASKMRDSHGSWQEISVVLTHEPLGQPMNVLKAQPLASPREIQEKERQSHPVSYDLVSEVSHGPSLFLYLCIRSKSLNPAHPLEDVIRLHLLKGGLSKNVWTFLKLV